MTTHMLANTDWPSPAAPEADGFVRWPAVDLGSAQPSAVVLLTVNELALDPGVLPAEYAGKTAPHGSIDIGIDTSVDAVTWSEIGAAALAAYANNGIAGTSTMARSSLTTSRIPTPPDVRVGPLERYLRARTKVQGTARYSVRAELP